MTGRKAATITDLFAKRSADDAVDRTWPSFGVGSKPMETANGADRGVDGVFDDQDLVDQGPVDQGVAEDLDRPATAPTDDVAQDEAGPDEIDGLDVTETTDLPATTDFAYSGALEAPVFDWPSAPDSESATSDAVDGVLAAVATTTTITVEGEQGDPAIDLEPIVAESTAGEVLLDAETDVEMTADEQDRSLPSPFLTAAGASAVEYADAPLAPIIDLRNAAGSNATDIDEAISSGEVEVVAALIEQGMLSTDGPISDRDVRTMVYVAFTSNELRKLLAAGGSPDSPNPGIDLGPVELFKDGMVQPPKTLYPGPPVDTEARSQLG